MNRIKFNRWEKQIERGYDFIKNNNEVYEPVPTRPPTVWDRVQAPTLNNNNNYNNEIDSTIQCTPHSQRGRLTNREIITARTGTKDNTRASTSNASRVPSLDLNQTQFGSSVSYIEPKVGPSSFPVQINAIRTGSGLNSIRP